MILRAILTAVLLCAPLAGERPEHVKSETAAKAYPTADGSAALWVDPKKWFWVKSNREDTTTLIHHTTEAQVRLIAVAGGEPPEVQLEETLERVRKTDPEARIVFTEERIVNGSEMLCVQIEAAFDEESKGLYYGYLYGDDERSVQVFVVAARGTVSRRFADFSELLNGLVVEGPEAKF